MDNSYRCSLVNTIDNKLCPIPIPDFVAISNSQFPYYADLFYSLDKPDFRRFV